jgi:tetratricopeptide (TPR) repeat protein
MLHAFLSLILALPASAIPPSKFAGAATISGIREAHDEFAFIGWNDACSAALRHVRYPAADDRKPGEPKSWRIGTMTIPPTSPQPVARWDCESRRDPSWSKGRAENAAEALRKTYRVAGHAEDVRNAPVGPQPGLADLLTTTSSFKPEGRVSWPPPTFRLSRVHYHPLGTCALLVFTKGLPDAFEYRYTLIRLLNPDVRLRRADAHATNGRLLYDKNSDPEGGEEELAIAVRLDPRSAASRYDHALLLSVTGRFDEALVELDTAVRLDKSLIKKAKAAPEFDEIRRDGRFLKIISKD